MFYNNILMNSVNKDNGQLHECKENGCQNFGSSNKLMYDRCAYQKDLSQSTSPLTYRLYEGAYENTEKCKHENKFYRPMDLVDVESELKNITRPNSRCPQFKYNPGCVKSQSCFSTFDKSNPIVLAPEICPIVHNNIPRMNHPGYDVPKMNLCNAITPQ
jgi:hypothetical protein